MKCLQVGASNKCFKIVNIIVTILVSAKSNQNNNYFLNSLTFREGFPGALGTFPNFTTLRYMLFSPVFRLGN